MRYEKREGEAADQVPKGQLYVYGHARIVNEDDDAMCEKRWGVLEGLLAYCECPFSSKRCANCQLAAVVAYPPWIKRRLR